jgi:hypothetical protein
LDEPRLLLEIDQLIGVQPLDGQVERRVRNGIATESGRLSSSHFVVFGPVPDDSSL